MAKPTTSKRTRVRSLRPRPLIIQVPSESKPGESYTVTVAGCDCPDWTHRHRRGDSPMCKHIIAAYLDWMNLPVDDLVGPLRDALKAAAKGDMAAVKAALTRDVA